MTVQQAVLPKNKGLEGMTVGQIAKAQGKGIIDASSTWLSRRIGHRIPARREQRR